MSTSAGILCLDLGTITGWAVARPGDEPAYGHWRLPADRGDGAFFSRFRQLLLDHVTLFAPRLIVYEAPLITASATSVKTVFRLFGLASHAVQIADIREVRSEPANNSTVKRFVAQNGHAKKHEVAEAVRRFGWDPENDNVSDALAILLYAESKHAPQVVRAAGPLFAASATA